MFNKLIPYVMAFGVAIGLAACDGLTDNQRAAQRLVNSMANGNVSVAEKILDENYVQHNLNRGTGRDAFIASVQAMADAPEKTTVKTVRIFQDGSYVFMHNTYNLAGAGDMVAFDVFRVKDGKVMEHWDNVAAIAPANPSGHTQTDGATRITELDKTSPNKELVAAFVMDVLHGRNPGNIEKYFDGDKYIQHNSNIADGVTGLQAAIEQMNAAGQKMVYNRTHMILGQGNFILAISEGTIGGVPTAFYDMFRVENGKIAEHWDVVESITPENERQNQNGKF